MSRLSVRRRVLAIFFPEHCVCCDEVVLPGAGVCDDCRDKLPRIGTPICPLCGHEAESCRCRKRRRHFDRLIAPLYHEGQVADGLLRFKHTGDPVSAAYFAAEMAERVRQFYDEVTFDGVVYVPSSRRVERARGFNPSAQLARALAKELSLPVLPLLSKIVDNAPQKSLSAVERSGNVLGVFDVVGDVAGKTLLLADDVATTGATLDECAKMLKIYGAEAVYAVTATLARPAEKENS